VKLSPTLRLIVLVPALFGCAAGLFAHEQTQARIAQLDRMIAADPLDAGLHMQRGETHRMLGRWDAARRDYERSLALDPGLTAVHLCEGRLWMDENLPERAIAPLDLYIAGHPADPAGHSVRARALALLGRHGEAASEFDQALTLTNATGRRAQPDLYLELARALIAAGDGNRERALAVLEDGLTRLDRPVALDLEALAIERALGRTDAALIRLERLAAASSRAEIWLTRRAETLEQAGRMAEAQQSWRAASSAIERLSASRRASAAIVELNAVVSAALRRLVQPEPAPPGAP